MKGLIPGLMAGPAFGRMIILNNRMAVISTIIFQLNQETRLKRLFWPCRQVIIKIWLAGYESLHDGR
jgi:hypothetical protein